MNSGSNGIIKDTERIMNWDTRKSTDPLFLSASVHAQTSNIQHPPIPWTHLQVQRQDKQKYKPWDCNDHLMDVHDTCTSAKWTKFN